jgi:hypothetical protein
MFNPVFVIPLATYLVISNADSVPKLDVTMSCRAAATYASTSDRMRTCLEAEQRTYDQLVKVWSDYPSAERAKCVNTVMHFEPTYTELITCLEMGRDAKKTK